MAKITIDSFRGEAPRLTPRALPPNAAQVAINARLQSGDLESWRGMLETASLANDAQTIYLLNDAWLSWESDVDVARGPIAGDTTFRAYLTGPDEYDQPRFTNYALATTGSQPYPVTTRPLGVPGPVSEPTLVIGVDPSPTTFTVDVLDEGDALETSWTTSSPRAGSTSSSVEQDAATGNPAPSYKLSYDEIHNNGEQPFAYKNFGVANAAVIHASCDIMFGGDTSQKTGWLGVGAAQTGAGVLVGIEGGVFKIKKAIEWSPYSASAVDTVAAGTLSGSTWYTIDVTVTVNANGTQTVTASLLQNSAQIVTLTATGTFTVGDYCGVTAAWPDDSGSLYQTYFDNIHVQASGSNGYTPINIATSYVYTFVNDLGEESTPSAPSSTIQRPDGVSVAVTTPTTIPSGISSDYGIATKRIYRAASGNTGTVFRFVAEIDLATETYEDVLTDEQLGEVLESEEYDLPPDDLRGIITLPNGVTAGFSKNQLCLSAQNRPHAWPVGNRLITDTDIVAIANIDTTVVVGTESFVYSASGNDPSAYSMSQPGAPQACVAKRSMRYMNDQVGVVFASPDGLMAMTGPTTVRNVTEGVFTRRQWQDLVPETIRAAVHDDIYFFSYGTNSSASGGMFMLDLKPSGFGLVRLDYFANAMYSDPLTDKLFMTQTDAAPAETVLFLFHMTGSAGSEGVDEFGGPSIQDQTGATWNAGTTDWRLVPNSPYPMFGQYSISSYPDTNTEFSRAGSNPSFSRPSNDAMAVEAWVYATEENSFCAVRISFNFSVSMGSGSYSAFASDGTGMTANVTLNGGSVVLDEWVHLRASYDGTTFRLFIDGVLMDSGDIDLSPVLFVGSSCSLDIETGGGSVTPCIDEAYAVMGTALSTSNFTPPVAPWPNP